MIAGRKREVQEEALKFYVSLQCTSPAQIFL